MLRQAAIVAAYSVAETTPTGSAGPCFCMGSEHAEVEWVNPQQLNVGFFVQGGGGRMCTDVEVTSTWLLNLGGEPVLVVDSTEGEPLNAVVERRDDLVTIQRGKACSGAARWSEVLALPPSHSE